VQPAKWPCHLLAVVHIVSQLDHISEIVDQIMVIFRVLVFSKFLVGWTNYDVGLTVNFFAMSATPQISSVLLVTSIVHFDGFCNKTPQPKLVSGLN
jgi:hypothetical protein